jgi:hypothetical protein
MRGGPSMRALSDSRCQLPSPGISGSSCRYRMPGHVNVPVGLGQRGAPDFAGRRCKRLWRIRLAARPPVPRA